jgi:hypothetical protein
VTVAAVRERTCNICGWVAFAVTRADAEASVASFNDYFGKADAYARSLFGNRRASITGYEKCFGCAGPYTNFRDAVEGDCPIGCTLQPIITEDA